MSRVAQLSMLLKLTLVGASGFVDAFGFLTIAQIYTANMSGNSVALGVHWAHGDYIELFKRGVPILTFIIGIFTGAAAVELGRKLKWRSVLAPALALECVGLIVFMVLLAWAGKPGEQELSWRFAALAGLAAFAMGIQNSALYQSGTLGKVPTYVTGQLVTFGSSLAAYLFTPQASLRREEERLRVRSTGSVWVSYVVSGGLGAWLELHVGVIAFVLPIIAIALVACIDFVRSRYEPAGE